MRPPILRPAAAADVEEAYRWYEDQRAGLAEEFLGAVQAGLEMIADHPLAAPVVHSGFPTVSSIAWYRTRLSSIAGDHILVACDTDSEAISSHAPLKLLGEPGVA